MTCPKIKSVQPLPEKRLRVIFVSGDIKTYDCTPLLEDDAFSPLKNDGFFKNVQADPGGYGISWSDAIDLSESELWINGIFEGTASTSTQATASEQSHF